MLYQELPHIDSSPLDGWSRWLAPILLVAAALTVAALLLAAGFAIVAGAAVIAGAIAAVFMLRRAEVAQQPRLPLTTSPDYSLVGSALGLSRDPVALTDGDGSLLVVNTSWRDRFAGTPPLEVAADEEAERGLKLAQSMAWRDGAGCVAAIRTKTGTNPVEVERVGGRSDLLLWRFPASSPPDPLSAATRRIDGAAGQRLSASGVLAAVVDANGAVVAANRIFSERALGAGQLLDGSRFPDLVEIGDDQRAHLVHEVEGGPLRAVHIPLDSSVEGGAGTFLLFDSTGPASVADSSNLQALLDVLPVGLALVDRDGRFLTMNAAFRQAAGLKASELPVYPGDLVVKEDKGPVADAVRRNSRGPAMSGDLAVRLAHQPADPVALTIAGLRGLGDAAVLLLLKDNSEEAKLKRQVAQATKMQVVGQLAGGVAHDFNNILTAIIGHCDLMLMRHTPGDIDYDDIQQ